MVLLRNISCVNKKSNYYLQYYPSYLLQDGSATKQPFSTWIQLGSEKKKTAKFSFFFCCEMFANIICLKITEL